MSFNDVFERIMRKRQSKAEGTRYHRRTGRPRKNAQPRPMAEVFEELRQRAHLVSRSGLVVEITAQSRNKYSPRHRKQRNGQ